MITGKYFCERFLGRILTEEGKRFVIDRMNEQKEKGIIEEALGSHCVALEIPEQLIRKHYFDLWANWKPSNFTDLYVYVDDEVKQYCYNSARLGEKYKGRGLYLYLAAKYYFRCYYTGAPLLPLRQQIISDDAYKCPENFTQMYAWYPSVDHLDSVTTEEVKRHSLENLLLVSHEINRMFGSIDRNLILKIMHHITSNSQLPKQLSIDIGKQSLVRSSRKRRY